MKRNNYEEFQHHWNLNKSPSTEREKNYSEWSTDEELVWSKKPIEEVESYYINLKNYIVRLKQEPEKPYALIHKKKQWRDGLLRILQRNPITSKHYNKEPPQKKQRVHGPAVQPSFAVRAMPTRVLSKAEQSNPGATSLMTSVDEMRSGLQEQRSRRDNFTFNEESEEK